MKPLLQLLARNRAFARQARADTLVRVGATAQEATVYMYGPIVQSALEAEFWGGVASETFVPALRALDVDTIHLRIDSPGGDVFGGQAIAQALRDSKARVIAHVDGLAASAATIVAIAADEVEIAIGGMFMVHRAWTFALGNTHDMLEAAALLEKIDGTLATQYAQRTGADEAAMLDVMDEETWMTAQEAVDSKFVDRIANQDEQDEPAAASTQWDLSAYANAPAPAAPIGAHVTASAPQIKVTTMNERVRLGRRVQMARAPAA